MSQLLRLYSQLEKEFPIDYRIQDFQHLMKSNNNLDQPIHRWFPFKEAFSCNLLPNILYEYGFKKSKKLKLLDPFCGVGTSIISAYDLTQHGWYIQATGVECNPFLQFVASTKANCFQYSVKIFEKLIDEVLNSPLRIKKVKRPALTTLRRPEIYSPYRLKKLLALRQKIHTVAKHSSERDLLLIGYASTLEKLGGFRKDGRALRITKKKIPYIREALTLEWRKILEDLKSIQQNVRHPPRASILLGDGRNASRQCSQAHQFDLIFYSPPYLNNIDYTEVYKVELWMLGFISNYAEFRKQRLQTFRSHPSIKFPEIYAYIQDKNTRVFQEYLGQVLKSIPEDKDASWRRRLVKSYFDDCYRMLLDQKKLVKKKGKITCVIGNSLHGGETGKILIATDLLIALLAQSMGLEVERVIVARYMTRRDKDNHFLRESVIIMNAK